MQLPKIIDNKRKSMYEIIDGLLPNFDEISIATWYWDLNGTALLIDKLLGYKKIRLLIGREPLIPRHALQNPESDFPDKDIFHDLEQMWFKHEYKDTITKIKELIDKWILEVRVYTTSFLHAKCYILGNYECAEAIWIIWSSNFTKAGLTANAELNSLESDHRIVTFQPQNEVQEVWHLYWFDQFWNDENSKLWNWEFVELLWKSPVGDELFTPYEMYIKTLYEMYKDELVSSTEISEDNKTKLMPYQIRNVHNLIRKLQKNKVAMLADSVWLGKTATAIEVIKQYKNPKDKSKWRRVEVIVPSSLEKQWYIEMAKFWLAEDFIPVTPFHNENRLKERQKIDHYAPVNLFVIDESHNLRNTNSKRYDWVYRWVEKNPDAHVLLLTATPINNQLSDLTNQILLAAKWNPNIAKVVYETANKKWIKIDNFEQALKDIESSIRRSITKEEDVLNNYERLKRVIREIIWKFIVRNTRHWVVKDPEFTWKFPKAIPQSAKYEFDVWLTQKVIAAVWSLENSDHLLWFDTNKYTDPERQKKTLHPLEEINEIPELEDKSIKDKSPVFFVYQLMLLLGFLPYRWKMYEEKFHNRTYEDIFSLKLDKDEQWQILSQLSIYGMLRITYLKRLESSVYAISQSVKKYQNLLIKFRESIHDNNQIISFRKLDLALDYLNGESLDDAAMELVNPYDIPDGFKKQELLRDIDRDLSLVKVILQQLEILHNDDSKIRSLAETVNYIHENNINNGKVLLFSFFSDTIDYLRDNLGGLCPCLTGDNAAFGSWKNKSDVGNYADRFAPRSKWYEIPKDETEINFLFSTDVLSEWQNLQDCWVIINYDLHWNPVRMIQRNGRINRLWSEFDNIYIYNMFPEKQLDHYLWLVKRLENKIEMINFCIGLDQPVLNDEYEAVEFVDDIKKLYTNPSSDIIDELEEKIDLLSTEDWFLQDLRFFNETADVTEKEKIYNNIPMGKRWSQPNVPLAKNMSARPDVLISSKLYWDWWDWKTFDTWLLMFATTDRLWNEFRRIETLIALQLLKCETNIPWIIDGKSINIKVECQKISDISSERLLEKHHYESNDTSPRDLKPTEQKFIEELIWLWYNKEDWSVIKDAFSKLSNSIRRTELNKIYNKAKSEIHNIEKVKKLVDYAKESMDIQLQNWWEESNISNIKPMLYYVWFYK